MEMEKPAKVKEFTQANFEVRFFSYACLAVIYNYLFKFISID